VTGVVPPAEQIEEGICNALAAGDVHAAVDMLRVLATVDPRRAELVLDVMQASIALHPSRRTA
jgi:hypothetical protein